MTLIEKRGFRDQFPILTPTEDMKPRAALYLRVSTKNQHIDNQRPAVTQVALTRGYDVTQIYEEKVSATASCREAWERLKLDAHRGMFDVLIVSSIDRLGRSMTGNIQDILMLEQLGVQVVSSREAWLDTASPTRSLLIAVLSWVAQEEGRQLRLRVQAGLDRARREGKQLGRPPVKIPQEQALALRTQGVSLRKAATTLGCGASTLHRFYRTHDAVQGCS